MDKLAIELSVKETMQQNAIQALQAFRKELDSKKLATNEQIEQSRRNWATGKELTYFFPLFNGMVFISKVKENFSVMGFRGRAVKHDFYYSFTNENRMRKFILDWAVKITISENLKAQRRNEHKSMKKNVSELIKVGDIFRSSWGYEQINVNYYQVTGIKGNSTIKVREIASQIHKETHYLQGEKLPAIDCFIGDEIERRIRFWDSKIDNPSVTITINSVQTARLKHKDENGNYSPDYYSSYY